MTTVRLLLALALPVSVWAANSAESLPLAERVFPSLQPILQTAASQSPRMVTRALDLEIAENNRIAARAGTLPTVGGSFRFVEARDDRADLTNSVRVQKSYYDFGVTQALFHWGERVNNKRIGEIQKAVTEGNYREGYRGLVQEIRSKFTTLIILKVQVQRWKEGVAHAKQQAAFGEERLAKKVISEVEMAPLRLNAELAQINLDRSEFDYEMAKDSFARLTGTAKLRDDQIPDEVPAVRHDQMPVNQLLASFLGTKEPATNEAVVARYNREIAELTLKNENTRLRPKFNFIAGVNQDEQAYTINAAQKYRVNSFYAGVSATWTVFDGFASSAAKRNAIARLRQSELDSEEIANRLGQQAQSQARQVEFSGRLMSVADRSLASAQGNVHGKQTDFQRGLASESDVTLARLALLDQRIATYNSRSEYLWRVADFLGTLSQDPAVAALAVKQ